MQASLDGERQRLEGIHHRTVAWRRRTQTGAFQPAVDAVKMTPTGSDIAEPENSQRNGDRVAVLHPVRKARWDMDAFAGEQINSNRILLQMLGVLHEFAVAPKIRLQAVAVEDRRV